MQVLHGVADVDPVARDTARSYRLGPRGPGCGTWSGRPRCRTSSPASGWPPSVALILDDHRRAGHRLARPRQGDRHSRSSSGAVPPVYALIVVTGLLGVLANLRHPARRSGGCWPGTRRSAAGGDAGMRLVRSGGAAGLGAARSCCSRPGGSRSAGSADFYRPPLSTILDAFADTWTWDRMVGRRAAEPAAGWPSATLLRGAARRRAGRADRHVPRRCARSLEPVLEFLRAIPPPVLVPVVRSCSPASATA